MHGMQYPSLKSGVIPHVTVKEHLCGMNKKKQSPEDQLTQRIWLINGSQQPCEPLTALANFAAARTKAESLHTTCCPVRLFVFWFNRALSLV